MTPKKNEERHALSPALDRLLKLPEGFIEKRKVVDNPPKEEADEAIPEKKAKKPAPKKSRAKNPPKNTAKNAEKNAQPKSKKKEAAAALAELAEMPEKKKRAPAKRNAGANKNNSKKKSRQESTKPTLKIIPLGGLGEIGKNMTAYETDKDILIVDCGLAFPDNDMLGVDLVIPDFTYLIRNREKIRGLYVTHGHEDHIGAIPYFLREINVPVYSTSLTIGLIEGKLKEFGLNDQAKLKIVKAGDVVKAGSTMTVEFIHVNHSFPDSCGFAITTPAGVIVQTGDFKIDYTPIDDEVIDLGRFGELGDQGVLALLADSTNAEKPGYTASERTVGYSFEKLFHSAGRRRIVIATFASNVHRIQQVIDSAVKTRRKVVVFGRSMVNVVQKAIELGYLKVRDGVIIDIDDMRNYTDDQLVVISTGSQGEPLSALSRMASGDHRQVKIGSNDYIIISATPIPGNEKHVGKVINGLMKLGAEVIYEKMYETHVSGHACQDEIKTILALTKPKFYMPVHGEYKHLKKNASIATGMGFNEKNIIIADIGNVIETNGKTMRIAGNVPAGRVLVDGLGVGDVGSIVLRDRKLLSEDGLIVATVAVDSATGEIVSGPELTSRGFVYMREAEDMMNDARTEVINTLEHLDLMGYNDWNAAKNKIRDNLSDFIYTRTKRKPMILPVILEV